MYRLGWTKDLHDHRDYDIDSTQIISFLKENNIILKKNNFPNKVDLRKYFPAVFNQGNLGSCTANAAAGIVVYYENVTYIDILEHANVPEWLRKGNNLPFMLISDTIDEPFHFGNNVTGVNIDYYIYTPNDAGFTYDQIAEFYSVQPLEPRI